MWRLPEPNHKSNASQDGPDYTVNRELNLFGVFSLGISVAALTLLCHSLEGGDGTTMAVISATGILSAVAYGWNETFWTEAPLVSLNVIKHNRIWAIYLTQFLASFATFGVSQPQHVQTSQLSIRKLLSNISEFFTRTTNATASFSGSTFISVTVGCVVGSPVFGFLIRR